MAVSLDDQLPATIIGTKVLEAALGPDYAALALGFHYWAQAHAFNTFADADRPAAYVPELVIERAHIFKKVNPKTAATAMVASGLWERVEGYYVLPDYLDYNPSTEKREHDRRGATLRKRRDRVRRRGGEPSAEGAAVMSRLLSRRDTNRDGGRDTNRDGGRDNARDSARARMPLTLNPLTPREDHRPAAGSLAVETVENRLKVLRPRQLQAKVRAPRQLKALIWREVEVRYALPTLDLYEDIKCAAAKAGFDYGFQAGFDVRRQVEIAQVRLHIRELVQAGLGGFMLAHAVDERLQAEHLIAVLDPDSLTRAIEAELTRLRKQRRHA